jgi:hypothetical protein
VIEGDKSRYAKKKIEQGREWECEEDSVGTPYRGEDAAEESRTKRDDRDGEFTPWKMVGCDTVGYDPSLESPGRRKHNPHVPFKGPFDAAWW